MNKENYLKNKILNNEIIYGTWITIPSVLSLDVICSTNKLDFVILDREHGPISFEKAQELIICAESNKTSPVLRVHSLTEAEILRSLDVGSHGIQVPNINNLKQIENFKNFSMFPPIGNRGFSPFTRSASYSLTSAKNITQICNDNLVKIVNLEGKDAYENIDSILDNDFIDVYFIGLFDLSKTLGNPGDIHSNKTQDVFKKLIDKIRAKEKYIGTITSSLEDIIEYKKVGVNYIVHLVDVEMLRSSYMNIFENLK